MAFDVVLYKSDYIHYRIGLKPGVAKLSIRAAILGTVNRDTARVKLGT
jgi:hypothetical protein